jgi:acetylornithine deacetylase/succinyl-diaminopimelate desuccinylase-like protein
VERFGTLNLPDTAPVITGEIPAPHGAPTVLFYGHHDVVGAGDGEPRG